MTDTADQWASVAQNNAVLLGQVEAKLAAAERDRDGWELIAADQAALVKQVLADLTTACDDLDAAERRARDAERERDEQQFDVARYALALEEALKQGLAMKEQLAAAERENAELKATLGAAAAAGVELGQKLAEVYVERDTALESLDIAYGWLTTACAALDAAEARERAARERAERILDAYHASYRHGPDPDPTRCPACHAAALED